MGRKSREKKARRKWKEQLSIPPPLMMIPTDHTAPWTHQDKLYFREHPEAVAYARPVLGAEEGEDLRERPGYALVLRHLLVEGPAEDVGVLVVRCSGGRVRSFVLRRDDEFYILRLESLQLELVTDAVVLDIQRAGEDALDPPQGSNPQFDFCGKCKQELPDGGVDFMFDELLKENFCGVCAQESLEAGKQPTHIGIKAPGGDHKDWPLEVQARFEQSVAFIKTLNLPQKFNYKQRQGIKALADLELSGDLN